MEDAKPFKIGGVYCRLVPLTRGQYAIVWESDYAMVMQRGPWSCQNDKRGHMYARRMVTVSPGIYKVEWMHKLVKDVTKGRVDHRSGVSLDNRQSNLRKANRFQNNQNQKTRSDNQLGAKGVCQRGPSSFRVRIQVDGVPINLGTRKTLEAAVALYSEAAARYFGEFARVA